MITSAVNLDLASNTLNLSYADGTGFSLPAEFLRVHSPSAEVQNHGQPILQTGKLRVRLTHVAAAGTYALKLSFDDGHDTGLFTWQYLHQLGSQQQSLWETYLAALSAAGKSRDPDESVVKLFV